MEASFGTRRGKKIWNLYDDLDDWHCAGDESSEEDPEEDMDNSNNTNRDPSRDTPPCEG